MASEEQLRLLLAAADEVLPTFRNRKRGRSLTDAEVAAIVGLGKFWLLFDNGVQDGQMAPYLGVATVHELEQQLRVDGVIPENDRIRLKANLLAREAQQLAAKRQRENLDASLQLRSVKQEPTTADTNRGIDPRTFEDPAGTQWFGRHGTGDE